MKTDPDKALLDRIRTREELEKRGYTRKTCTHCQGIGWMAGDNDHVMHPCLVCEGRGFRWQAPLMC